VPFPAISAPRPRQLNTTEFHCREQSKLPYFQLLNSRRSLSLSATNSTSSTARCSACIISPETSSARCSLSDEGRGCRADASPHNLLPADPSKLAPPGLTRVLRLWNGMVATAWCGTWWLGTVLRSKVGSERTSRELSDEEANHSPSHSSQPTHVSSSLPSSALRPLRRILSL